VVSAIFDDTDASGSGSVTDRGSVFVFEKISGTWTKVAKMAGENTNDYFGSSVDIYEDAFVVGSALNDYDASGLNLVSNAGKAYLYYRNGSGVWTAGDKLVDPSRTSNGLFGIDVAISGSHVAVGAQNNATIDGALYVFDRCGAGSASLNEEILSSDLATGDNFALAVDMAGENIVATSRGDASSRGSAYFYASCGGGTSMKNVDTGSANENLSESIQNSRTLSPGIKCYPNPANEVINLTLINMDDQQNTLYVSDINGKMLAVVNNIQTNHSFDINNLAPGIYIIQVVNTTGTYTQKFIKK
jgi:hypothetical protein